MRTPSSSWVAPLAVLAGLAFVYCVLYPQDLAALLSPLERVLAVSGAVSPWLYGLLAVALLCRTALRLWGARPYGTPTEPPPRTGAIDG